MDPADYRDYRIQGKSIEDMNRDELLGSLKASMDALGIGPKGRKEE